MPTKHAKSALLATTLVLVAASGALAQRFQPFAPQEVDYDFQLFAPAELGDFGNHPKPNVGIFAAYDRMTFNINRSNDAHAPWKGDWAWGNRYELGYMTEDRHGWLINFWNMGSPNVFIVEQFPRDIFRAVNFSVTPGEDEDDEDLPPDTIRADRSPDELLAEFDARSADNDVSTNSLEVNKTFRLRPTHHGLIIEPFFGMRYVRFREKFISQHLDIGPLELVDTFTVVDDEGLIATGEISERIVLRSDSRSVNDSDMVGGQIGSRFVCTRGRWVLSTEVRAYTLHNFASGRTSASDETITARTVQVTFIQPGREGDVDILPQVYVRSEQDFVGQEFERADSTVFGGELRIEAAYQVTRDIALRAGFHGVTFANGVARGNFDLNDDLTMFGATFGVQVNR